MNSKKTNIQHSYLYPKTKKSLRVLLCNSLLLTSLFLLIPQNVTAENLSTLQKQLKETKNNQAQQSKQQTELESRIATIEQETAKTSLKLQEAEKSLQDEALRLQTLKDQTKQLQEDKVKQQKLLEQQLISAYMSGQNDLIKLLLNQEDISRVLRAKSYYHYLNQARFTSIEALQNTELQLEKNKTEQADSLLSLKNMRDQLKVNKDDLTQQSDQRTKALRELKQDINYQSARIEQLGEAEASLKLKMKKQKEASDEAELAAAKSKATKTLKQKGEGQNHSNIAALRGELNWPIRGKVLSTFGSQRSDQVKWKGIAIAANEGEKVRAVTTGRVLFAGYFKGYGMVIALDHSDDYITLYGYNQTLLYQTGDIVFRGDAIALAGHSGGQDKNSLYFEISHKGKAEDPILWLKARNN